MVIKRQITRDLRNRDRIVAELELRVADEGQQLVGGISPGFSTTCDIYEHRPNASGAARQRMGREADGGGADTDAIARAFPKLALLTKLHLSDPDGAPMHAQANSWYWYAGSRTDLRDAVVASGGYTGFDSIYAWRLAECDLSDDEQGRQLYCYLAACRILRVPQIPDMPALDPPDDTEATREAAILREQARELATSGVDVRDYAAVAEIKRQARELDRQAAAIERAAIAQTYANVQAAFTRFVDAQRPRWAQEAAEARALLESLPEEA